VAVDMKCFNRFLQESVIDPDRHINNVAIFDLGNEIKLKHNVRAQILAGIGKLSRHMNVKDYTLIGSILTHYYAEDSDVDINILVSNKDSEMHEIRNITVQHSGKFVEGTKHPINFHVLNDESDFKNANDSADAVFDISTNTFIRQAINRPFQVEKYMSKFKKLVSEIDVLKQDMVEDLIDYKELKLLSKESIVKLQAALEAELKEIEDGALGLIDLYDKVKTDRADAFARPLTTKDIQEYGTKNRLPPNVVYKLLERHHYMTFLHNVKEIIGSDNKLSKDEADELSKLVNV
jgi:predicted nucleotidyltransferase